VVWAGPTSASMKRLPGALELLELHFEHAMGRLHATRVNPDAKQMQSVVEGKPAYLK
jgi:hypothetical protein